MIKLIFQDAIDGGTIFQTVILPVLILIGRYPDGKEVYTFKMDKSQREVIVYSEYSTCMVDGKSRKAMMGRGGAYCYHCSTTIEAYHTPAGVRVEVRFIC